jgi:hypothetical protein
MPSAEVAPAHLGEDFLTSVLAHLGVHGSVTPIFESRGLSGSPIPSLRKQSFQVESPNEQVRQHAGRNYRWPGVICVAAIWSKSNRIFGGRSHNARV